MATQTVEKELVQLEKDYWEALKDGDVDTLLRLTDNPSILTGAQGVASIDHASYRQMMKNPTWSIEDYEISDVQVRMLTDDAAIVAYKVKEELTGDSWVCSLHTESILGDPFGRDRRRAS